MVGTTFEFSFPGISPISEICIPGNWESEDSLKYIGPTYSPSVPNAPNVQNVPTFYQQNELLTQFEKETSNKWQWLNIYKDKARPLANLPIDAEWMLEIGHLEPGNVYPVDEVFLKLRRRHALARTNSQALRPCPG